MCRIRAGRPGAVDSGRMVVSVSGALSNAFGGRFSRVCGNGSAGLRHCIRASRIWFASHFDGACIGQGFNTIVHCLPVRMHVGIGANIFTTGCFPAPSANARNGFGGARACVCTDRIFSGVVRPNGTMLLASRRTLLAFTKLGPRGPRVIRTKRSRGQYTKGNFTHAKPPNAHHLVGNVSIETPPWPS